MKRRISKIVNSQWEKKNNNPPYTATYHDGRSEVRYQSYSSWLFSICSVPNHQGEWDHSSENCFYKPFKMPRPNSLRTNHESETLFNKVHVMSIINNCKNHAINFCWHVIISTIKFNKLGVLTVVFFNLELHFLGGNLEERSRIIWHQKRSNFYPQLTDTLIRQYIAFYLHENA